MAKLLDKVLLDIQSSKQKRKDNAGKKGKNSTSTGKVETTKTNSSQYKELTPDKIVSTTALDNISFENPIHTTPEVLDTINKYRGTLKYVVSVGQGPPNNVKGKDGAKVGRVIYETIGSPSLFNPYHSVQAAGITSGIPLLDTQTAADQISAKSNVKGQPDVNAKVNLGYNINDCSIANLVKLSNQEFSTLGHAKYKYTDFMYCKEVGQISNNHLITLRRFANPIGDNIFAESVMDDDSNLSQAGDIGHLVTWFGTEDNKLEDILKYTYAATWKPLEAKIQEKPSEESRPERGIMGGLVNLFSPSYNKATEKGIAPSALSLLLGSGGTNAFFSAAPYEDNPAVNGSAYDQNRVYSPKDTIQSTEIYEGKLTFSNEFTLVFNYKLRGYENINAKSAMLDLLANILVVTYKAGSFWAGEQRITGAPPNASGWKKVENFKKDAWNKGGTFITDLLNGGNFGDAANNLLSGLSDAINSNFGIDMSMFVKDPLSALKTSFEKLKGAGFGGALKGMIGNQLGRPAVYAFDSLLTRDNTGLWHVTIGNPLNPIAVMGNLIMDSAEITHSGPLGLDDFPTDLKVTITLKHARPRDSVDIQRMYTMGRSAIYGKIGQTNNFYQSGLTLSDEKTKTDYSKEDKSARIGSTTTITIGQIDTYDGNKVDPAFGWIGESNKKRFKGNLTYFR